MIDEAWEIGEIGSDEKAGLKPSCPNFQPYFPAVLMRFSLSFNQRL
jgi:hypothetical protein